MTKFTDKRQRITSGNVAGVIIDPKEPHNTVHYQTRRRKRIRPAQPATINWSAHGSVSIAEARRYAEQILAACDAARVDTRAFEPDDEVTYPSLREGYVALIRDVKKTYLLVEEFVPGRHSETVQVKKLHPATLTRVRNIA